MKTEHIEILHFDVFYRMGIDFQCNIKDVLNKRMVCKIPSVEELEFLEILKLPVIQLVNEKTEKPEYGLKFLCWSCLRGCLFLNLFSGEKW
jgi:hypothetical protein